MLYAGLDLSRKLAQRRRARDQRPNFYVTRIL